MQKTFDEYLKKCVRTQQPDAPPLPPCTQRVRIGRYPPPPSVRTYFMDDPLSVGFVFCVPVQHMYSTSTVKFTFMV